MLNHNLVSLVRTKDYRYPFDPPFNPSQAYPELRDVNVTDKDNYVYDSLRILLYQYGLDKENFNTPKWNPLKRFVKPGGVVIIKPNLVTHFNHARYIDGTTDMDCVTTHGSVIRFVIDYISLAMKGYGRVIIADCPIQGADWDKLLELTGLNRIKEDFNERFPNIEILYKDFRLVKAKVSGRFMTSRIADESKIDDYYEIDIKDDSLLIPLMTKEYAFGVSQYPKHRMRATHSQTTNKYLIAKEFIDADLFINLPKLKSHMKSGVSCALKNLVGIIGHKDYLPHFIYGSPKQGGDEYPDGGMLWDLMWWFEHKDWEIDRGFMKIAYQNMVLLFNILQIVFCGKKRGFSRIGGGSWWGNDTLWRTILDINRVFFYFDNKTLNLSNEIKRNYFCIVDGLVGGHRESPLAPHPIKSGFFFCGENPVAIDTVASSIMNFDYKKIRLIENAYKIIRYPLTAFQPDDIITSVFDESNNKSYILRIPQLHNIAVSFTPSLGFIGHIEKELV